MNRGRFSPDDSDGLASHIHGLQETAHELSNWVSLTMNLLARASVSTALPAEDLQRAVSVATRATGSLQVLMWQLAEFHRQVVEAARIRSAARGTHRTGPAA
jgi:hypothetical protein